MYDVDSDNEGFLYWMEQIKKGASREEIEKYFRQVALKENSENEWDNLIKNDLQIPKFTSEKIEELKDSLTYPPAGTSHTPDN